MKTLRTAIAAILALATASDALAGRIATPSVIHTGGEFWCTTTNLSSTSREITIELVYDSGDVATSRTESVAPGASMGVVLEADGRLHVVPDKRRQQQQEDSGRPLRA